jgi:hypothetical protein
LNNLKNIPLYLFRKFLLYKGLNLIKTEGGHEKWSAKALLRPVIIQTHIDPIPEFIIRNNLKTIRSNAKEFLDWANNSKKEPVA